MIEKHNGYETMKAWADSADLESSYVAGCARELLRWDLDFVPHWYVFPLPQDFNSQCTDASPRLEVPAP